MLLKSPRFGIRQTPYMGPLPDALRDDRSIESNEAMTERQRDYLTLALTLLIVLATAVDIGLDASAGTPLRHILHEVLLMAAALGLAAWVAGDLRRKTREVAQLREELNVVARAGAPRNAEVEAARTSLSHAIDSQFADWGLSQGEKDVGRLLLKGLSIREIAALRETQEKTVRQQASAIYRKADLPGRHAFAAWFLEDLL
ncbi:helix-turn-helix transcriptional regulator [Algiphilus sp.]|uniref:helix-turn-helix transcriptional regulator n=1 Tax=Algiphilus sp. TaxID=1872431 RepID=UPI003B51C6DD